MSPVAIVLLEGPTGIAPANLTTWTATARASWTVEPEPPDDTGG